MNRVSSAFRFAALCCALTFVSHAQSTQPAPPPVHGYRITYTLTTSDAGKRVGSESYIMTVDTASNMQDGRIASGRGIIKVGEKTPVATGSVSGEHNTGVQTQFTYLDVGLNIDAMVTESPNGLWLASKVEQSSVAPQPVIIAGVSEPVIRQVVLNNSSSVSLGKPITIGSLHLPDTQRRIDVEVNVEQLP